MSNTPTLAQRRRIYRMGAGPRVFGPVGVQLTVEARESLKDMGDEERSAAFGALDDCAELDDRACDGCGYHECSCAPVAKPEPAYEMPAATTAVQHVSYRNTFRLTDLPVGDGWFERELDGAIAKQLEAARKALDEQLFPRVAASTDRFLYFPTRFTP